MKDVTLAKKAIREAQARLSAAEKSYTSALMHGTADDVRTALQECQKLCEDLAAYLHMINSPE